MPGKRPLNLLVIDDDPVQVTLLQKLLQDLGLPHVCEPCVSGPLALDYLMRRPPFESARRPDLILLDLDMPGMNGIEVLRRVKSEPDLLPIPIIVMSSSRAVEDIAACYQQHANAYIRKPEDLEGNLNVLRNLDQFWAGCELIDR